jgi:hypothetical protein
MAEGTVGSRKRSAAEGTVLETSAEGLFTFPWPGPGNSEGPVDPDRWSVHSGEAKERGKNGDDARRPEGEDREVGGLPALEAVEGDPAREEPQ